MHSSITCGTVPLVSIPHSCLYREKDKSLNPNLKSACAILRTSELLSLQAVTFIPPTALALLFLRSFEWTPFVCFCCCI